MSRTAAERPPVHPVIPDLMEIGRSATARGLVLASGGNLSAVMPDRSGFVVTRAGSFLDALGADDFVPMSLDGTVRDGGGTPSSEWRLHQQVYLARSDAKVVLHFHPQHAVLLDALGYEIRLMTLDHHAYVGSIGTVEFHPNGSVELAEGAGRAARSHDCVVLRHHGCSVLAETPESAYRRALNLEEAAVATFRALQLGDTATRFPANRDSRHG